MKTKLLIEQHFHGCFGIDFNTATVDEVLYLSKEILKYGIGGIFPTLVTDSVENTKHAISVIKEASKRQTPDMAKILGRSKSSVSSSRTRLYKKMKGEDGTPNELDELIADL